MEEEMETVKSLLTRRTTQAPLSLTLFPKGGEGTHRGGESPCQLLTRRCGLQIRDRAD